MSDNLSPKQVNEAIQTLHINTNKKRILLLSPNSINEQKETERIRSRKRRLDIKPQSENLPRNIDDLNVKELKTFCKINKIHTQQNENKELLIKNIKKVRIFTIFVKNNLDLSFTISF